jgi:hypothetical protein
MYAISMLTAFAALASAAAVNTTQEYRLKTQVISDAANKKAFDDLYMVSYHTGAGESDATFSANGTYAVKGFLAQTNTTASGTPLYNQEFDFGTGFAWEAVAALSTVQYTAWQPVRINAGSGYSGLEVSGFFLNETGLQWSTTPDSPGGNSDEFGGWLGRS